MHLLDGKTRPTIDVVCTIYLIQLGMEVWCFNDPDSNTKKKKKKKREVFNTSAYDKYNNMKILVETVITIEHSHPLIYNTNA